MTEPLYEATVLPGRAVSWSGRLYVSGEAVLLPLEEANALEDGGYVIADAPASAPKRSGKPIPASRPR